MRKGGTPALEAAVPKVELRVGGVLAPLELERDDREFVDGFKVVLLVEQGLRPLESFIGGERRGLLSRAAAGGKYCRDEETSGRNIFTMSYAPEHPVMIRAGRVV